MVQRTDLERRIQQYTELLCERVSKIINDNYIIRFEIDTAGYSDDVKHVGIGYMEILNSTLPLSEKKINLANHYNYVMGVLDGQHSDMLRLKEQTKVRIVGRATITYMYREMHQQRVNELDNIHWMVYKYIDKSEK